MKASSEWVSELPTSSIQLDNHTLKLLETSNIRKLISQLAVKIVDYKLTSIGILSWDAPHSVEKLAHLFTAALSQQFDRKCALVLFEGIRFHVENFDSLNVITFPELALPDVSQKINSSIQDLKRVYPVQVFVGPPLKTFQSELNSQSSRGVLSADAQILLTPHSGLPRHISRHVKEFSTKHQIKWLGLISVMENAFDA